MERIHTSGKSRRMVQNLWPEKGTSDQAVTRVRNLMRAWVTAIVPEANAPRCQVTLDAFLPGGSSQEVTGSGSGFAATNITYYAQLTEASLLPGAVVICSPGMFPQLETFHSLDMEFCLEACEIALTVGESSQDLPLRSGCQFTPVTSWQGSRQRRSRSAGPGKALLTTTSGERLHGWTVKYEGVVPARLQRWREAESSLYRSMEVLHVRPHTSLGGKLPMRSTIKLNACPSPLEVNDVRATILSK